MNRCRFSYMHQSQSPVDKFSHNHSFIHTLFFGCGQHRSWPTCELDRRGNRTTCILQFFFQNYFKILDSILHILYISIRKKCQLLHLQNIKTQLSTSMKPNHSDINKLHFTLTILHTEHLLLAPFSPQVVQNSTSTKPT